MKKKKLIIYDNQGEPSTEYPLPALVNESRVNWWAGALFEKFRRKAPDKDKVDHWDVKGEEE